MKALAAAVLAIQFLGLAASAQTTTPPGPEAGPTTAAQVNAIPQSSVIRILTPAANQQLTASNAVEVRFEVVSTANSAGTPNFLIQLDGNDPIRTTSMEQTFTGLAPGMHNVSVALVDANNTPVAGSRAIVQFSVAPVANSAPAPATNPGAMAATNDPQTQQAGPGGPQDPSHSSAAQEPLPPASSLLPLVSVIGFGVLVGGIASAMKTR